MEVAIDAPTIVLRETALFHQGLDIEVVPGAARHSSRGCVRLFEVAPLLEIGHHVADRRRRHSMLRVLRHRTGTDRFADEDERLHDIAQDLAIARRQFEGGADGSHVVFGQL